MMGVVLFLAVILGLVYIAIRLNLHHDPSAQLALEEKKRQQDKYKAVGEALTQQEGFTASHNIVGCQLECSVAVDETRQLICLVDGRATIQREVYPISKLVDVAVVEDGAMITETHTSRGSQVAGALVGGMLFGGVGAIIGGLSAKQVGTSVELSRGIDLRITVDDLSRPVWTVPFFRGSMVKTTPQYRVLRDQALQWHGLVSVLIRRADKEEVASLPAAKAKQLSDGASSFHVARGGNDIGEMKLARIHSLLAAGHLSAEDHYFDPQLGEWLALSLLPEA